MEDAKTEEEQTCETEFGQAPVGSMTATRSQETAASKRSVLLPSKEMDNSSMVGGGVDDAVIDTFMVVPPDGGWGWVVVAASFFSNLVVDGIIFAFGMYLTVISEALDESKAKIALIGSIMTGFYMMVGPFVSALANRYGFRVVAVMGSLLGSASFVFTYFANSAWFLIISLGVMGGIGFGLIYVPAIITVGFYFERWRALATSIAVCGSGIGTFVMPPVITALIHNFGWRGSFIVLSAMVLQCAIPGMLYRPLKPVKLTVAAEPDATQPPSDAKPEESVPLMMRIKMARDEHFRKSGSLNSVTNVTENVSQLTADHPLKRRRIMKVRNNNAYPTTSEMIASSLMTLYGSRMVSSQSLNRLGSNVPTTSTLNGVMLTVAQKRLSAPPYSTLSMTDDSSRTRDCSDIHKPKVASTVTDFLKPVLPKPAEEKDSECNLTSEEKIILQHKKGRTRTVSESSRTSYRSRLGSSKEIGVRPMYRSDIFYGSSLKRLPQYTSQLSSVGYHMSVSHLPTKHDILEEELGGCKLCPEAVQRTLATMLDMSLLRSYTFALLNISGFLTMMGFYIPYMYITDRALVGGMDENSALWLISIIGISNTVARILCGIVTSFPGINALAITSMALTLGGVGTLLSGVYLTPVYQFIYCCVFGFAAACFASLRSIVIVDLLGLDKLTNAFGLLLLFQGVAACIGSPMAGAFMEATGSYDASFYLAGLLLLASAVLLYPLNCVNRWEKRKQERRQGV
ncbi:monocarboxylate transporter 14 isoform X2 [Anabrus simplex]|uniref:monocarboxylate transporter 14 isoform X2 n=1 Tax=Anabrus simplex TaxID=316456 RepID=UPI0035A2CDB7